MKQFIASHPIFIDDLLEAAYLAKVHHNIYLETYLNMYANELKRFDNRSGWMDPFHDDNIFRLDCGNSKSSWKRWQQHAFSIAEEHEGQLFTYGSIDDLVRVLNESVKDFKNAQPITGPDWEFCWKYGTCPTISIGEGCTIAFEPVRGYYLSEDQEGQGHE